MSLQYDFYASPSPKGSNRNQQLHARVKTTGTTNTQNLAELIKETTSLSTADVKASLDALVETISFELSCGRRVHLDGLGYFGLSLSCPPVESPREIRAESVKVKNIVFRPEVEWKKRFRGTPLERAREKNHSSKYSEMKIEKLLTGHFLDHPFMTTREFCYLCGFTPSTGARKINQLLEAGKLRRVGYGSAVMYEPIPGNYQR